MIVRDVKERSTTASSPNQPAPPRPPSFGPKGFPNAHHRSLRPPKPPSASATSHADKSISNDSSARFGEGRSTTIVPAVRGQAGSADGSSGAAGPSRLIRPHAISSALDTLREVATDNLRKVQEMGADEREEERRQLGERFGVKVTEALKRRAKERDVRTQPDVSFTDRTTEAVTAVPDPLPGEQAGTAIPPDDLKERFFPNIVIETRKLAWLLPPTATSSTDTSIRFDLSGTALSQSSQTDLPSNIGLHHHGSSPDLAGYTIQDVLYLCRSTVPSQRITMLGVLASIIARNVFGSDGPEDVRVRSACEEQDLREKGVALGVEVILSATRSIGLMRAGIESLYEALGGSSWTWIHHDTPLSTFQPDDDTGGLESLPLEELIPRVSDLLAPSSGLPPRSTQQLTALLRRLAHHSQTFAEAICPLVPAMIRHQVLQQSWPLDSSNGPSTECFRLLRDVVASSRTCALLLLGEGIHDSLLKFVITSLWTTDPACQVIALEVLRIYYALGRYGLCASLASSARDIWRELGTWVSRQARSDAATVRIIAAYFDCLTMWTICAIDPHRTTPEHDLTWSQVSEMGWADEAIESVHRLGEHPDEPKALGSALALLVAWLQGSSINNERGGEVQRIAVMEGLIGVSFRTRIERYLEKPWREIFADDDDMQMITTTVRLHALLDTSPDGGQPLVNDDPVTSLVSASMSNTKNRNAPNSGLEACLRFQLLRLPRSLTHMSAVEWCRAAFALFSEFRPGDEPLALDLIDNVLRTDWTVMVPSLAKHLGSLTHPHGLQVLRPLLQYSVLPRLTHVVGPSLPSHMYLKATSTLRAPAKPSRPSLPLPPDWLYTPLDELLSSATSPAFAQAPPDWDASELDIVRATLILAQLTSTPISRSHILLNLMKVFMLEHDQQTSITSETDIFRDDTVSTSLSALMAPLTKSSVEAEMPIITIEEVAKPFLGEDVPFFQLYTDFLALYEAISFSHPLFAQLLLPPLAMSYPVDYRRLFWAEQSTALRSIRIKMVDVPLEHGSMTAFFDPREEDADVLAGYTRALVRGWVKEETTEFLFRVAVHHLAALFWEDKEEGRDSPRVSLLIAILSSVHDPVLKRLLEHDLSQPGELCTVGEEERKRRVEMVDKLAGIQGARRIASL